MRKLMLLVLVVLVCLGLAVVPATAVQGEASLVGHWEGVDGDGSRMIINISEGPGGVVNVFFKDFGASACGLDDGEILYAGQAKTVGVVEGYVLLTYGRGGEGVGNGALWCMANPPFILGGVPPSVEPTPFVTYDPGTDTLTIVGDISPFYRVRNN